MLPVLIVLVLLAALILFLIAPDAGRRELRAPFVGRNFAHRGLFTEDQSIPENSLPAFAAAARAGYGMELDVQFTSDRKLVVFHDDTLDRMTPAHGLVQEQPWDVVRTLPLAGTDYTIPLFREMLQTVTAENPNTPLIVEIKSRYQHSGEYLDELCKATLKELERYPGPYCIESFDPRVVMRIRRLAPGILRGQLADSYAANREGGSSRTASFGLSHYLLNFAARPHFLAWCPARRNWAVRLCAAMGAMMVYWTALPQDDATGLQMRHDAVIFQWYEPPTHY